MPPSASIVRSGRLACVSVLVSYIGCALARATAASASAAKSRFAAAGKARNGRGSGSGPAVQAMCRSVVRLDVRPFDGVSTLHAGVEGSSTNRQDNENTDLIPQGSRTDADGCIPGVDLTSGFTERCRFIASNYHQNGA